MPNATRGLQPSTGDVWVDFSFIDDLLFLVLPGDSFDQCVLLGRGAVMLKGFPFVNCLTVDGQMELESSGDGLIALPRWSYSPSQTDGLLLLLFFMSLDIFFAGGSLMFLH